MFKKIIVILLLCMVTVSAFDFSYAGYRSNGDESFLGLQQGVATKESFDEVFDVVRCSMHTDELLAWLEGLLSHKLCFEVQDSIDKEIFKLRPEKRVDNKTLEPDDNAIDSRSDKLPYLDFVEDWREEKDSGVPSRDNSEEQHNVWPYRDNSEEQHNEWPYRDNIVAGRLLKKYISGLRAVKIRDDRKNILKIKEEKWSRHRGGGRKRYELLISDNIYQKINYLYDVLDADKYEELFEDFILHVLDKSIEEDSNDEDLSDDEDSELDIDIDEDDMMDMFFKVVEHDVNFKRIFEFKKLSYDVNFKRIFEFKKLSHNEKEAILFFGPYLKLGYRKYIVGKKFFNTYVDYFPGKTNKFIIAFLKGFLSDETFKKLIEELEDKSGELYAWYHRVNQSILDMCDLDDESGLFSYINGIKARHLIRDRVFFTNPDEFNLDRFYMQILEIFFLYMDESKDSFEELDAFLQIVALERERFEDVYIEDKKMTQGEEMDMEEMDMDWNILYYMIYTITSKSSTEITDRIIEAVEGKYNLKADNGYDLFIEMLDKTDIQDILESNEHLVRFLIERLIKNRKFRFIKLCFKSEEDRGEGLSRSNKGLMRFLISKLINDNDYDYDSKFELIRFLVWGDDVRDIMVEQDQLNQLKGLDKLKIGESHYGLDMILAIMFEDKKLYMLSALRYLHAKLDLKRENELYSDDSDIHQGVHEVIMGGDMYGGAKIVELVNVYTALDVEELEIIKAGLDALVKNNQGDSRDIEIMSEGKWEEEEKDEEKKTGFPNYKQYVETINLVNLLTSFIHAGLFDDFNLNRSLLVNFFCSNDVSKNIAVFLQYNPEHTLKVLIDEDLIHMPDDTTSEGYVDKLLDDSLERILSKQSHSLFRKAASGVSTDIRKEMVSKQSYSLFSQAASVVSTDIRKELVNSSDRYLKKLHEEISSGLKSLFHNFDKKKAEEIAINLKKFFDLLPKEDQIAENTQENEYSFEELIRIIEKHVGDPTQRYELLIKVFDILPSDSRFDILPSDSRLLKGYIKRIVFNFICNNEMIDEYYNAELFKYAINKDSGLIFFFDILKDADKGSEDLSRLNEIVESMPDVIRKRIFEYFKEMIEVNTERRIQEVYSYLQKLDLRIINKISLDLLKEECVDGLPILWQSIHGHGPVELKHGARFFGKGFSAFRDSMDSSIIRKKFTRQNYYSLKLRLDWITKLNNINFDEMMNLDSIDKYRERLKEIEQYTDLLRLAGFKIYKNKNLREALFRNDMITNDMITDDKEVFVEYYIPDIMEDYFPDEDGDLERDIREEIKELSKQGIKAKVIYIENAGIIKDLKRDAYYTKRVLYAGGKLVKIDYSKEGNQINKTIVKPGIINNLSYWSTIYFKVMKLYNATCNGIGKIIGYTKSPDIIDYIMKIHIGSDYIDPDHIPIQKLEAIHQSLKAA